MTTDQTSHKMLMVSLADNFFAVDIADVSDVMARIPKTGIPMSLPVIEGVMNLRGQIVTEINMASVLNIESAAGYADSMAGYAVVMTRGGEHYSLSFDKVYGVVDIANASLENIHETVNPMWRSVAKNMCRHNGHMVTLIDLDNLFGFLSAQIDENIAASA